MIVSVSEFVTKYRFLTRVDLNLLCDHHELNASYRDRRQW